MKKKFLRVLFGVVFFFCAQFSFGDPEEKLARHDQARRLYEEILLEKEATPEKLASRWQWLVSHYPDTGWPAQLAANCVSAAFDSKRYLDVAEGVSQFCQRYGSFGTLKGSLLYQLVRIVIDKSVSEDIRRRCFDVFLQHCQHASWLLSLTQNSLSSFSLSPEEKYLLARKGEEKCGPYPYSRSFLWFFLDRYTMSVPGEKAIPELERFLNRYPEDSPETRQARKKLLILKHQSGEAVAEQKLKEVEVEEKKAAEGLKQIAERVREKCELKVYYEAFEILKEIRNFPPGLTEGFWRDFLTVVKGMPLSSQKVFLELALDLMPSGRTAEEYFVHLHNTWKWRLESAGLMKKYLEKNAGDIYRDSSKLKQLARLPFLDRHFQLLVDVQLFCGQIARKLGLYDAAAEYFFQAGRHSWDSQPVQAASFLEEAVKLCPESLPATQAEWFLSLLRGETRIVQGPLPRPRKPAPESPSLASLPLSVAKKGESVTIEGETIRLVSFNPKENLLKGATTIASSGQASLAVDGKKETFWHPESLPAVLVVNLPQPASLQRLVLRLAEHSYFTISFLDSSGQTISRYERDWDFWEHMQTRNLYPPKEVTLQVAPVPEVAYLKLELIESLGQAGISELEAYPCPYAACGSLTREIRLPLEATSVQVNWLAEEKQQEVTYSCQMESFRGFPVMRWRSPWLKRPAVSLRQLGGYAGIEFYGTNVSLLLAGIGKVRWQLDTGQSGVIEHPQKEKSEHLLAQDLPAGRHYLWLENEVFPAKEDSYGAGDCEIHGVKVLGQTRVASLVRFGDGKTWGSWLGPVFSGQKVAVASLSGRKPILCQTKVILDSRSVLGQLSPEVKSFSIVATGEAGEKVSAYQEENRPFFREELAEVAEAVNQRAVVVSYPKMGTSQEYEVAREIAEKVGVYLVSDDIGLNLYPGLVLAVGTPQRHRYCRQLLAAVGLWSDPEFLNREEGIVGRFKYGRDQQVDWLFVTGETPRTVVAAGKRLLSRLKTYQRPATAFRLFPADTLEMIYPWQLHMERKNLDSLTLTLGQNDRRSLQFGIVANRLISSLSLSSVKLVSDTGEVLTGVKVRPVGFYEWEPFFGDLRLPNFLIEEPVSLPANTATGIWVTVQTEAETKPGLYRGELTIRGEGQTETVPLSVRVLPVSLEPLAKTKTMSFAAVPWFFHRGTEAWRKAVKSLAENEADHSVSVVSLPMLLDWKCEEGKEPVRQLLVAEEKVAEKMVWTAFNAGSKKIPAGHVLLVEFSSAVRVQQLGTGARVRKISDLAVEVWLADGSWRELNLEEGPPEPLSGEKGTAEPFWYGLFFTGPQEPMSRLRFRSKTGNELEIGRIVAFSEGNRREPFTVDFSLLEQQMSLIEQVYREKKLPLPLFLSQLSYEVGEISGELVGVAHWHQGGCQRMFARQLSSFLRKCGRLERFVLKVSDEPRDIKEWTMWAKPYREARLRTMTCHSGNYPDIEAAVGVMEPWCPNYQHNVLRDFFRERQRSGEEVWWYCCGVPATRITGSPVENLPFYWLSKKWKFDGALNYAALHSNIHVQAVPFRYDHGLDHRIAYLPDGRLLDTTRRELEAEGIQDMKLIEYIQRRIKTITESGKKEKATALEQKLYSLLETIVPYKYGYASHPELWHQARASLYELAVTPEP